MMQHTLLLTCTEHRSGLLPRQEEYRNRTAGGCYRKAKKDGWRIEGQRAVCPNCARKQTAQDA